MIPYVRDIAFEYGRADQVSPRIRRVIAKNPGPFTFVGTGTYVVGDGEVAIIDPGPADEAHLEALLQTTAGERVTHILVTHSHADHSPLAGPLQARTGAKIYGLPAVSAHQPMGVRVEEGEDEVFRPDVEVQEGQLIRGPDWTIEALLTPGHAANHVAYALLEENALFPGDHVMGWSTTVIVPPEGDMGDYLASLDKVRARGFDILWPTHGPPVTEPGPFIDAYRAHRLDREAQILAQLAAGETRIKAMVPKLYAGVDQRLWPAAAQSMLAHLIHLTRTGRVLSAGEPSLESDYRLPA